MGKSFLYSSLILVNVGVKKPFLMHRVSPEVVYICYVILEVSNKVTE